MKKLMLTLLVSLFFTGLMAQTQVSGTVKDEQGLPIPGANVIIKGTNSGATTDFDGRFDFTTSIAGEQTLVISYLGFSSHNEIINLDGTDINLDITLKEGGTALEAVLLSASNTFRSQKESPLSISSLKQAEVTKLNPNSQADILRSVPGITAEGGGGETATNLFVRGLPSGGQFQFNPLQYDGIPLISSFGLNSSAHDVYARPDIGFRGVEFVRGGSAILLGAGSTAGIINYTSKTGDIDNHNIVNFEYGDDDRLKLDFYSGGQLGNDDSNTFYAVTGFLRYDEGPLVTGLPTRGGQIRANIKKKFEKGSFTVHGQFINDRAQFFLPLPLDGGSRSRLRGNDGQEVEQLLSGELDGISFLTPTGVFESPIGDGVFTRGGYLLADFDYNLNDDLKFKAKARFAEYSHNFALYIGGNGANPNPITLSEYVENVFPGNQGFNAGFQGSGVTVGTDDLVIDNLHIDRIRPAQDLSGELNLIKNIQTSTGSHTITLGTFLSRLEASDINYQFRTLSEFNNNPRLINLEVTDVNGNNVIFSQGGLTNRIGQTRNRFISQNRTALYLTDEFVINKWRVDLGFRVERTEATINDGSISSGIIDENPNLTPELANVNFADGNFARATVSDTDFAVSVAALYELNDNLNIYGNFSRGFFFPQAQSVNPITPGVYEAEEIIQGEVGLKLGTSKLSGALAVYYVGLNDRIQLRQGTTPGGGLVDEARTEQDTRTFGLEASGDWNFASNFNLRGSVTFQDHEITTNLEEDLINGGIVRTDEGNELARQPNFLANLGIYYANSNVDGFFTLNHTGDKFAANNNNVELDAISIFRLGGGYTFNVDEANNTTMRFGFSFFNLFDTDGVTEGDPRNVNQAGDAEFFFGRPVLPRRFFLTATLNF